MRPRLERARRPRPCLILTAGWSGENVLVRLLAASGVVRSSGFWLSVTRRSPVEDLRHLYRTRTGDAVHIVLARAADLFAINNLDPVAEIEALRNDGVTVLSLERLSTDDAGLSRALCGPVTEVLPAHRQLVEPADAITYAAQAQWSAKWLGDVVCDPADRLHFETSLHSAEARATTAALLADRFKLAPWSPPPEYDVPSAKVVWSRVANVEAITDALSTVRDHALTASNT